MFSPITASPLIYIRNSARSHYGFKHSIFLPCAVMFPARLGDSKWKWLIILSFPRTGMRSLHTLASASQPCGSDGIGSCHRSGTALLPWLQQPQEGTLGILKNCILLCNHDLTCQPADRDGNPCSALVYKHKPLVLEQLLAAAPPGAKQWVH